jgi:hypothetical protein
LKSSCSLMGTGDFPATLDEETRSADGLLRLFGKRIAFHKRVAGVISGLRGEGESPVMEREVERFMPIVGLMRLRELVTRYGLPLRRSGTDPVVREVDHGADS